MGRLRQKQTYLRNRDASAQEPRTKSSPKLGCLQGQIKNLISVNETPPDDKPERSLSPEIDFSDRNKHISDKRATPHKRPLNGTILEIRCLQSQTKISYLRKWDTSGRQTRKKPISENETSPAEAKISPMRGAHENTEQEVPLQSDKKSYLR